MLPHTSDALTAQEICHKVLCNGGAILDNVSRDHVATYIQLQQQLHDVDVSEDKSFQQSFASLHKFGRRRIKPAIRKRFFQVLESHKTQRSFDVKEISSSIIGSDPKLNYREKHFSLVTRLMHTLYPKYPIYDKNVAAFFAFSPPRGKRASTYRKMNAYEEFYAYLVEVYREILTKDKLYDLIRATEISLGLSKNKVSHAKILDLLLRFAGQLEKSKELIEPKQVHFGMKETRNQYA